MVREMAGCSVVLPPFAHSTTRRAVISPDGVFANQPFPEGENRGSLATRLRRINKVPARPDRRFFDRRQEPSLAQLIADERQWAHCHTKPLDRCLDREVEMLEDLIARRLQIGEAGSSEPSQPHLASRRCMEQRLPREIRRRT